jgi:hypothetical protein
MNAIKVEEKREGKNYLRGRSAATMGLSAGGTGSECRSEIGTHLQGLTELKYGIG